MSIHAFGCDNVLQRRAIRESIEANQNVPPVGMEVDYDIDGIAHWRSVEKIVYRIYGCD